MSQDTVIQEKHVVECRILPIKLVTVYNDRAEVKRTITLRLRDPGMHEIIVENIASAVDEDSIRVDGRGDATILEVQFQRKPALQNKIDSPELKTLEDRKAALEREIRMKGDLETVLKRRIEVLDVVVGQVGNSIVDVPKDPNRQSFHLNEETMTNLSKFFAFYEENSFAIRQKVRDQTKAINELKEKFNVVNEEIRNLRRGFHASTKNISILVTAKKAGDVELDVAYQVRSASWTPMYDIRAQTAEKTLEIIYSAQITQSSGEDWNEAALSLSTAQPSLGGTVPELATLNAAIYRPPPPPPPPPPAGYSRGGRGGAVRHRKMLLGSSAVPDYNLDDDDEGEGMFEMCAMAAMTVESAVASAGDHTMATSFSIPRLATIPCDGARHRVNVGVLQLTPRFLHETVPSKCPQAFLTAALTNTSAFAIIPGPASVYLNNSFVAKTQLKAISPGEEFTCSLGVDPSVKVEFKPPHKYHEQFGLLTRSSCDIHEQNFTIKNLKQSEAISVILREQIPKSSDVKIKVKLYSPDIASTANANVSNLEAKLNVDHNLEWTINIAPGQSRNLNVKWSVDYPQSEKLVYNETQANWKA